MKEKTLSLKRIKPYPGNPRVNAAAVDAVAKSIEAFGYNVPIVVDKGNVIVTGHTRWLALKKLGTVTEVKVIEVDLTEEQAREFRIADNKTHEFAGWDEEALVAELRSIEDASGVMGPFFAEKELEALMSRVTSTVAAPVTQAQVDAQQAANNAVFTNKSDAAQEAMIECSCAHCGKSNPMPAMAAKEKAPVSGPDESQEVDSL